MIQTLSDALAEKGYAGLTPVQEAVTRPELQGADLLVSAQTGSGKTVAFGLALGPTLLEEDGTLGPAGVPLALIVAPTRELALQVMRELGWLYAKAGARVASCVGGMDMREERRALERGAHIVVGTPGRLRDHIQRGSLDLGQLRAVVLDEADEMLDMGFREDLEFMLAQAPEDRRTLMFSATVPPAIAKLAARFQRDGVRVSTASGTTQHADIAYQALRVAPTDAETAIINVLRFHDAGNALVFANTRAAVSRLSARFTNRGFSVVTLSGELSQSVRTHALQAMRDGRARVCVATDVAARGIDLPNLELVIHAELPSNAEGLLHRSGRTGRAGRKGTSVLIVPPKLRRRAEMLLRAARIEAEWATPPGADEILRRDEERLLADPAWDEAVSEEQAAFAARLLERHGAEAVAAAYLRLYRSRQSAPEDLGDPDAPPPSKERRPFGPSVWFALSVGRDRNAEPRWLLPLILRVGRLDKDAIGAIRVQPTETLVEIAENRAAGFEEAVGPGRGAGGRHPGAARRRSSGSPGPEGRGSGARWPPTGRWRGVGRTPGHGRSAGPCPAGPSCRRRRTRRGTRPARGAGIPASEAGTPARDHGARRRSVRAPAAGCPPGRRGPQGREGSGREGPRGGRGGRPVGRTAGQGRREAQEPQASGGRRGRKAREVRPRKAGVASRPRRRQAPATAEPLIREDGTGGPGPRATAHPGRFRWTGGGILIPFAR
jgi:ATP-dependent RNA helicase DeaD